MIWQNPWAWLGLLLVAVPIAVHLLARRTARVQPFPTLRFLQPTPPLATRRARITNPLLLALRIAIVTAAVAALAQPLWLTAARDAAAARALARVIVIDTSASVSDIPTARAAASSDAAAASASVIIETSAPGDMLAGAAAWLETRRERGEIIVYSDFQLGAVDSLHVAGVPAYIGLRLRRSATRPADSVLVHNARTTAVLVNLPLATYEWTPLRGDSALHDIVVVGTDEQRAGVTAAVRAADLRGAALIRRPIALLFDDSIAVDAHVFTQRWMAEVAAALRSDALLRASSETNDTLIVSSPWLALTADGSVTTAAGGVAGEERMLLRVRAEAASVTTAALIVALGRATSGDIPVEELEPRTISDARLGSWQREASGAFAASAIDQSDARWLWLLALLLLGVEAIVRRQRTA